MNKQRFNLNLSKNINGASLDQNDNNDSIEKSFRKLRSDAQNESNNPVLQKSRSLSNSNYRRPLPDLKAPVRDATHGNNRFFSISLTESENMFDETMHIRGSHLERSSPNSLCQLPAELSCYSSDEEELVEISRRRSMSMATVRQITLEPRSNRRSRSNEEKRFPFFPTF